MSLSTIIFSLEATSGARHAVLMHSVVACAPETYEQQAREQSESRKELGRAELGI